MTDEPSEIEPPKDFGEFARRYAAFWADIADTFADTQNLFKDMAEKNPGLIRFAELGQLTNNIISTTAAGEQKMRLMGQISAGMSLAYDEMMAAGGPDNAEAYAQYTETSEWLAALVPRFDSDLPDH
ncbi:MAG TPA: hypothetical protein VG317_06160 [Pseudonocardiaceae bacterium]|nr:hypothetical protein [Pseudonocardiaceae bacterium]